MTDMTKLADAIEAVKLATPDGQTWTERDFSDDDNPPDIDQHIATILNAVVSGDLAEVIALRAEVDGYMEWAQDVKRLTRQLDIEMHGDGAAQQASLCDLIGAGKDMRDRAEKAEARATAAEADAERLAAAGVIQHEAFGACRNLIEAIAAHTQRVNAKEDTQ